MSPIPAIIEHSVDECEAASAFVSLCSSLKRFRSEEEDDASTSSHLPLKKRRSSLASLHVVSSDSESDSESDLGNESSDSSVAPSRPRSVSPPSSASAVDSDLLPSPYFYYRDHSTEQDDDPFTPLTPPARVPNFPAKMHAILSRPDLSDVVTWMPHGRSWKIINKSDFESRVLPTYFDHCKLSSFVRQANGWGFRRITKAGSDRNTYYHPRFLRGLPHLCKKMKRPGVAKKVTANPAHEPDLAAISRQHPIEDSPSTDESILLTSCTLKSGPKARMPVHLGIAPDQPTFAPREPVQPAPPKPTVVAAAPAPVPVPAAASVAALLNGPAILAAALQQAVAVQKAQQAQAQAQALSQLLQGQNSNNSFAAGFAAATALQKALAAQQQNTLMFRR